MSELSAAFLRQAKSCAALGSPFMGRLMTLCADRIIPGTTVTDRLLNWGPDMVPSKDNAPLRLAGGLHALVLSEKDGALAAAYPPQDVSDDVLWAAVFDCFETHEDHLMHWLNSAPQTNEVRRSAVLIPAAARLKRLYDLPFALSELGASAGLNMMFDQFALSVAGQQFGTADPVLTLEPDWTGPPPDPAQISIVERCAVDLNPLDAKSPQDRLRLLSYLWADQPHRKALTEAAISVASGTVDKGDAGDWLEARLTPRPGTVHLIYHTVAWQYFPEALKTRCTQMIEAAGKAATHDAPLAWLAFETDGSGQPGGAITLRHWPGDHKEPLGRADFHGRWVNWTQK